MSFQDPVSKCTTSIPGLGTLEGLQYANGVQQFCGIPYADLPKRWTRSILKTSWNGGYHDGAHLGHDCPMPIVEGDNSNDLVPVPPSKHLPWPMAVDELSGLVMNIVIPHACEVSSNQLPVFVYVHGGSLLYGGANLPIFDAVNFVSHSISIGLPIICVNFNYRVGIGGFLASNSIKLELQKDGHAGNGNFGFTDQQVGFDWVQKYIAHLGGDPNNVTAVGESAGGISISNQLHAMNPPVFHRAICMSGLSAAIPPWTQKQHQILFEAVCSHFKIDPCAESALEQLRAIPQQDLANATPAIQGVPSGTGNPCLDGWFYHPDLDPRDVNIPPPWLKDYMFGDTYHEGIIFHLNLLDYDYEAIRDVLQSHILDEASTDKILSAYEITQDLSSVELFRRVEHMCGDAIFKIPNYVLAHKSLDHRRSQEGGLFFYHFDQRSRLPNALEGTAYHAHELLYLFGNLDHELNENEQHMAREFKSAWIKFTYGLPPWQADYQHHQCQWMVWGPDSCIKVKTEEEDQLTRDYVRMKMVLQLGGGSTWKRWLTGVDSLVNRRWKLWSEGH
ncbi:hypothetical protein N7462_008435 [Penicillium macrosclerotiorum]|uniref:uncharacterized protein n=1 Tax=Penicillium macrosclerotiorum TaxID=303699 RepID=UPI0025484EE8|nr:uncharacterized protein N7462_008435 [Penicillium macrosclerotiorum]KAJ5675538.1 hypothetical protein N7462_008435 [Penicillium macrosclerotiorum]